MDTTPARHSLNTVLMLDQRLRRWPNIEPTLAECTMFEEKLSCQYIHGISCFATLVPRATLLVASGLLQWRMFVTSCCF